jgi:hypothetical protein
LIHDIDGCFIGIPEAEPFASALLKAINRNRRLENDTVRQRVETFDNQTAFKRLLQLYRQEDLKNT